MVSTAVLNLLCLLLFFAPNTQSLADNEGWRRGRGRKSLSATNHQPTSGIRVEVGTTMSSSTTGEQTLNEMLVPLNSTTALICEPVFNQQMSDKSAFWYKDGIKIAEVTGHSNAIIGTRGLNTAVAGGSAGQEQFPQVGFLIIVSIRLEDRGDYWCAKQGTVNHIGEKTRLKIAFLQPFSSSQQQLSAIVSGRLLKSPIISGERVVLECPSTPGMPPPTLHWLFNEEPVDFAASISQMEVLANGSLVIQHYGQQHAGVYKCVLANFVGHTSGSITLGAPLAGAGVKDRGRKGYSPGFCTTYLRSGILWFLIGCLTTSCIVLVYLLAGMLCYRCANNRRSRSPPAPLLLPVSRGCSQQPTTCWKQCCWLLKVVADPSASPPGFRKPVAPVADRLIAAPHPTHPIVHLQTNISEMD